MSRAVTEGEEKQAPVSGLQESVPTLKLLFTRVLRDSPTEAAGHTLEVSSRLLPCLLPFQQLTTLLLNTPAQCLYKRHFINWLECNYVSTGPGIQEKGGVGWHTRQAQETLEPQAGSLVSKILVSYG